MKYLCELRRMHPFGYLISASAATLASSLFVGYMLMLIGMRNDVGGRIAGGGAGFIAFGLSSILIGPAIESLALIGLMRLLELVKLPEYAIIAISSTAAAAAHSIASPAWGLIVFFPFVIFSATYLIWRNPETSRGFRMCCGVHVIHNCIPGFILIYDGAMTLAPNG